jgi:hypothetical protein
MRIEDPSAFMSQHRLPDQPLADPKEDAFREYLQLLIYDWIQIEIPSWKPERSPAYRHDSQALNATVPGSENAPAGLVYFKNVFDPCWSDKDLARLDAAAYPWILMILSPCERFYEFEARLREIAHNLHALLIWRPDTPSRTELENLRRLVFAQAAADEEAPAGGKSRETIHQILMDLYVTRGQLIGISGQRVISNEMGSQGIRQYLSACLTALSKSDATAISGGERISNEVDDENQALQWAVLLAGRPDLQERGADYARDQLIEWWMNSVEGLSRRLQDFPEPFKTTHFWNEIKFVEGHTLALKPVLYNLRGGASSFRESMDLLGRHFAWDSGRVLKWKKALDNLGGLTLWLPTFQLAQEYLRAAFPLGQESLDRLRASLLQSIKAPLGFLEEKARGEFDKKFLEFKNNYMDCYYSLHEDALHLMSGLRKDEPKIDPVSLRNLDLLSDLQYTDKGYLNRVKVLARRTQRDQCNLPLRDILERYPRCFCNFNPCVNPQIAISVSRINGIIQDGIEYFRNVLRGCGDLILDDLKSRQVEEESLQQINALLGDGPMVPLKWQTVRMLNGVILNNSSEFLTELRKIRKIRPMTQ